MWTENDCKSCQWCCRYENIPIPGGVEYAHLYWIKGRKVYWEPFNKQWYSLEYRPCQHINNYGCKINNTKPRICKEWYCPFGPTIYERYDILVSAGNKIMERLDKRGDFYD